MLLFAGPMILGNLLQQCYNIVDMLIVGRALGAGGSGGSRLGIQSDDISDFGADRNVYGKRIIIFLFNRKTGYGAAAI